MTHLLTAAYRIQRATGKSVIRQVLEALSLRIGRNKVGLSEYFDYSIWDPSLTGVQRREFIGWRRSEELDRTLNADCSRVLANDKLINYLILKSQGLPIPRPIATFTKQRRRIGAEHVLSTQDEVRDFLAGDVFPFFVKPVWAGYGKGVVGVAGWEDSRLRLLDGKTMTFDEFFAPFNFLPFRGMLFQGCLEAHPAIREICGSPAISCVRMICFVTRSGPVIHTAFWKIVTGRNMLDNFSHGDYGNCLGAVDLTTGTITHAIARMGLDGAVTCHPTTGKPLVGFKLPDWAGAVDLVKRAAGHFPGLRIQNWDVALCPTGPVLVELNTESELAVPQAISHRGLMDHGLQDILHVIEVTVDS